MGSDSIKYFVAIFHRSYWNWLVENVWNCENESACLHGCSWWTAVADNVQIDKTKMEHKEIENVVRSSLFHNHTAVTHA